MHRAAVPTGVEIFSARLGQEMGREGLRENEAGVSEQEAPTTAAKELRRGLQPFVPGQVGRWHLNLP